MERAEEKWRGGSSGGMEWVEKNGRSRFYESSQQRYANVAPVTWLARHFETVKCPITSSPRARPSNWVNAELYRYKIVAVSLHKTHMCVVKSLVKIAAVSWHSLRRFIKPAPGVICDRRVKGKVYKVAARPAMLYGLETEAPTKRQEAELEVAEMSRCSLGVTRMDKIRNE